MVYFLFTALLYNVYLSEGNLYEVKKDQFETGLCRWFYFLIGVKTQVENSLFTMYVYLSDIKFLKVTND
jgi:hypothetical protein